MKALKRKQKREREGELYAKIEGKYIPLRGVAVGPNIAPLKRSTISDAIEKYKLLCTSQKCQKNQKVEGYFFERFRAWLDFHDLNYIDEVSDSHMMEFQNFLSTECKHKASSVNRRFCTVKNFFNMCVRWDFITKSPCREIKKKRVEANPYKNWTEKEFQKFIKSTANEWTDIFLFLYHSGCRPVEMKNLKWTDINHDRELIIFNCGKNSAINREFPMYKELSEILHRLPVTGLYVFTRDKKQIQNDSLSCYARKHLNRLGLRHLGVYGLRHTFARRLADAGFNPYDISRLMGHSDIKITMTYVHDDKNNLKHGLNRLNQ